MAGIGLAMNDLSGWNLAGQNLVNSYFYSASLQNADLSGADTRGARDLDLAEAITQNAILPDGSISGLRLHRGDQLLVRDDDRVSALQEPDSFSRLFGLVPPPRSPISLRVQQQFAMTEGSVLQVQLEADAWDSLISFEPGIPVELGGALELNFVRDVDLATQVGRTLRLFDWRGVTPNGKFEILSPYVWDVSELYTTGDITLLAVPKPAHAAVLLAGTIGVGFFFRASRTRAKG